MTIRSKLESVSALIAGQIFLFPRLNKQCLRIYGNVRVRGGKRRLTVGKGVVFRGDATLVFGYDNCQESIRLGDHVVIEDGAYLNSHGGTISIGANSFVGVGCVLQGMGGVLIEDHVLLGPNVQIFSSDHIVDPDKMPRGALKETFHPVVIGKNVWVGASCILLSKTNIPNNTVIGAGCVVRERVSGSGLYIEDRKLTMKRAFE